LAREKRGSLRERLRGVEEVFVEVKAQAMGKFGLALIAFFVVVSLYALVAVPTSFADKWLDLTYWSKYPGVVPPEWVSAFGTPIAPFVDKFIDAPDSVVLQLVPQNYYGIRIFGVVQKFSFDYRLSQPAFPQGVLVYARNISLENITYGGRLITPANITLNAFVLLHRPNNVTLIISESGVTTLQDFAAAGGVLRFSDQLVAQQVVELYKKRGASIPLNYAQTNAARLAFGTYDPKTNETKPLTGTYTIEIVFTYLARNVNPAVVQAEVNNGNLGVQVVEGVVKGSAYGLMGTDNYGRDLYKALLFAFPIELVIGFVAAVASVIIGLLLGVVSGYYGGWVDETIQRTIDIMGNIPVLPILVLVGAALQEQGASGWAMLGVIILLLVIFGWGGLALIIRSMTLSIKSEPYIDSARAIGASNRRIIFRHIIPQVVPYAMASLVFSVPAAILTEAGLSVLGIRHNLPTWGTVLAQARDYIFSGGSYNIWWWILPPGLLMGLMSIAFVFLGLALETVVEPRLKRR
jgi:ABC-type dipeptide/oligopeptide/nickel transport system permease subunit